MTELTMERTDLPGLRTETGLFEWGYNIGADGYARVRFVAASIDSDRKGDVTGPVAPFALGARVSASFVGSDGQVDQVAGQFLITPEESHSWQFDAGQAPVEADWLDGLARNIIYRWVEWARTLKAGSLLLVPASGGSA